MSEKTARKYRSMPDCEARKHRALRRLGTDNPACCHCGNSDWRVLELHHIAGREFGDMTVIHCRNCHAVLSDAQSDHPPVVDDAPTMLDRIGRLLINLSDFFGQLGKKLKEFGEFLIEFARTFTASEDAVS
jgi:hypothetical protein